MVEAVSNPLYEADGVVPFIALLCELATKWAG